MTWKQEELISRVGGCDALKSLQVVWTNDKNLLSRNVLCPFWPENDQEPPCWARKNSVEERLQCPSSVSYYCDLIQDTSNKTYWWTDGIMGNQNNARNALTVYFKGRQVSVTPLRVLCGSVILILYTPKIQQVASRGWSIRWDPSTEDAAASCCFCQHDPHEDKLGHSVTKMRRVEGDTSPSVT